jgi:hypothetical protein
MEMKHSLSKVTRCLTLLAVVAALVTAAGTGR